MKVEDLSIEQLEEIIKYRRSEQLASCLKKRKNSETSRKRSIEKFELIKPKIIEWCSKNLKQGDLIQCKGYRGFKQVVSIDHLHIFAMCGAMRKGVFMPNGSGSATSLENVTEIRIDNKWTKIKDLING